MFPRYLALVCATNRDIFFVYFFLGLVIVAPSNILRYYFIETHNTSPADLAFYGGIIAFPWSIKAVYGMISDRIRGFLNRRLQIAFGFACSGLFWSILGFDSSSVSRLVFFCTFSSFFLACSDVVLDAIMVERISNTKNTGRIQSIAWASRSFGSLVGCIFGFSFTFHRNRFSFIALFCLVGSFFGLHINEKFNENTSTMVLRAFCAFIYNKTILLFVLILFVYGYEPSDGTIVEYMMIKKFDVNSSIFGVADMISYLTIILASMFFDAFLRQTNIVSIILATNIIALGLMVFRNLVITDRFTVEPDLFLYANCFLGAFVGQIAFLPFAIIAAKLCPKSLEGTAYAFFMAVTNFSGIVSRELSGIFTNAYNIKNTIDFQTQDMDSFYVLCIVLDAIGLIIILCYIKPFTLDSIFRNKMTVMEEKELDNSNSDSEPLPSELESFENIEVELPTIQACSKI